MAADKRDKEETHLSATLVGSTPPASAMKNFFLRFFVLFHLIRFSKANEYKLCATVEYDNLCKWIEASSTEITCVRVSDSADCLLKMQKREADFGTFYSEEAFLAARFLGDAAVVLAEVRHPDRADRPFNFETVAVVQKTLYGGLSALKGLSYCHPGFSKAQHWSDRVLKDFEKKVVEHFEDDIKCNSAMRSAYEDELYRLTRVFGRACRPGTWAVSDWWDKKLKREYHSLCDQCEHPITCSYKVQNGGRHSDALRCLTLHGGNVTYTALEFVRNYFELDSDEAFLGPQHKDPSRYVFLCPDGSTRPLTAPEHCSWVKQPWPSVVALASKSSALKTDLMKWLEEDKSHLKNVLVKGNGILKFRDQPITVADYIRQGRSIPDPNVDSCRGAIKWCITGESEKKKCEYISAAALTHGLPNQIRCVQGNSKIDCLRKVNDREADVVYIDTEMGYISRKVYNLTAAAYLETQKSSNYYGVLVVKGNSVKKLKELQGKRACFPQYNGLGWLTYFETLKSLSIISSRSCSNSKKIWNYFSRACAPGAKDPGLNPYSGEVPDRLCKGCANASEGSSCEAKVTNPYFGEVGALKCLNNGDGDVAFLDFHTIRKFYISSRQNPGDPIIKWDDLKILCKDGSLENFNLTNPDKCSFIQVNGGEMVMKNDLEPVRKTDIYHLLMELDDLFGITSRSYNPSLKMFETFDGKTNVLFKESAVSLVSVYETQNRFVNNYMNLLTSLDNCLDDSGSYFLMKNTVEPRFTTCQRLPTTPEDTRHNTAFFLNGETLADSCRLISKTVRKN